MLHRGSRFLAFLRLVLLFSLIATVLPTSRVAAAPQEALRPAVDAPHPATTPLPAVRQPPLTFQPPGARPLVAQASTATPQVVAPSSLQFIANQGQEAAPVRFVVAHQGSTLFFTPNQLVYALPHSLDPDTSPAARRQRRKPNVTRPSITYSFVRQRFLGAAPHPTIKALEALPGTVNYLIGNDPAGWRARLATYTGVIYQQLYPGIDLSYHGDDQQLKSVFTLAPGSDPTQIRWRYTGAQAVTVDAAGTLLVQVPPRGPTATQPLTITEQAPIAWQEIDGRRQAVAAAFAVDPGGTVRFQLGTYDPARPLIIDPTLSYSTYLGGSGYEQGKDIVADGDGNVYVVGSTTSTDFPLADSIQQGTGYESAFITKLSADGSTMLFSTYLGGSRNDYAQGVALATDGNILVAGTTWSTDFPVVNPIQPNGDLDGDAFVVRLAANGYTLAYSTYLGGTKWDESGGLAVDPAGAAYIAGYTYSTDFPTVNPFQDLRRDSGGDVFVTKVNAEGNAWSYSTYLGGSSEDAAWMLPKIAVDTAGAAYITGGTYSADFPLKDPLKPALVPSWDVDAYITKLSPAGNALDYSTYFGGNDFDESYAIAVDADGQVYLTGDFSSTNLAQAVPGVASFWGFWTRMGARSCRLPALVARVEQWAMTLRLTTRVPSILPAPHSHRVIPWLIRCSRQRAAAKILSLPN